MKIPTIRIQGSVKHKGRLHRVGCPNCFHRGPMELIETSIVPKIGSLPRIPLRRTIIAVCHNCQKRFVPTKKALHQNRRTPRRLIWPEELFPYQPYPSSTE